MDVPSDLPAVLVALAREVSTRGWEAAKRRIVARTGSVGRFDRFGDDVADAVFLRIQRNAQVGRYADEGEVAALGRGARRLEGGEPVTLWRAAPPGAGIRPGDFAAGTRHEAGFYAHGGHVLHRLDVPRRSVIAVDGSSGGGQEYVLLPGGYVPPEPVVWFGSFREFWRASRTLSADVSPEVDPHRMPRTTSR